MRELEELERLTERAYERAGLSPGTAAYPLFLASRLLDGLRWADIVREFALVRQSRLVVQRGLNERTRSWATSRALARWLLELEGEPDAGRLRALAACLRTPREAFCRVARVTGPDFARLAYVFGISQSTAVLRYGETMGHRVALIAPDRELRLRGSGAASGVTRTVELTDAPGRRAALYAVRR